MQKALQPSRTSSKNSWLQLTFCRSFVADGALAFMPLTNTKRNIEDAGPVSSLELAFRVFSPDLDANQWFLQEQHTEAAGDGRTFSIGKIYSEAGKLLAEMSQTCILRKKKA
jgi:acyl-CoA thioesterase